MKVPFKKAVTAQTLTLLGATLVKLLQDEDMRRQLSGATAGARAWVTKRRSTPALTTGAPGGVRGRFGQGALERRVVALRVMAAELRPVNVGLADQVSATADDLARAVSVAANMPTATRWKAQRTIGERLDEIEAALIDAVLPKGAARSARG